MCELLAMSARHKTDLNSSIDLFRRRGGEIGSHADGWGLAVYEENIARVFKEPKPASDSELLDLLRTYDLPSRTFLAHIRKANPSKYKLKFANTHPFTHEWGGRTWSFAHNGKLERLPTFLDSRFTSLGQTDSEHVFCGLMEGIARLTSREGGSCELAVLLDYLAFVTSVLNPLGELNYVLTDGRYMFAHAHTRLHLRERTCRIESCGFEQTIQLITTKPLTDEFWCWLPPHTLLAFEHGKLVGQRRTKGGGILHSMRSFPAPKATGLPEDGGLENRMRVGLGSADSKPAGT